VLLGASAARAAAPTVVAGPEPADPDAMFEARCADADSAECAAARGLLLELMIRDLDVLERSHDRRAVETARLLLDSDEPELQAGALRILARWAGSDEQGFAKEVAPLLLIESRQSQRLAAMVLRKSHDPWAHAIGEQYERNHPQTVAADDDTYAFPDVASRGFDPYPGALPYPPGDGPRSFGLVTTDPVERVVATVSKGTPAIDWAAFSAELSASPQTAEDAEIAAAYQRRQDAAKAWDTLFAAGQAPDQATTDRLHGATAELAAKRTARPSAWLSGLPLSVSPSDGRIRLEGPVVAAKFLILERQGAFPARYAAVYRDPLLDLTVLHLMWNPGLGATVGTTAATLHEPTALEQYEDAVRQGDAMFAAGDYFEAVRRYEDAWRVGYGLKLNAEIKALDARLARARKARDGGDGSLAPVSPVTPAPAPGTAHAAPAPAPTVAPSTSATTAQAPTPLEEYDETVRKGDALYAAGDYFEAVRTYEHAWRVAYNNKLKNDAKTLDDKLAAARKARDEKKSQK
jgi:tetratricopeptide (TPR) repeat protein